MPNTFGPNTLTDLISVTASTADGASTVRTNNRWRGGHFIFQVSAASTSLTPKVQALVPGTTGTFYDVLVGAAITTTGTTVLKVYPGIAASVNAAASDVLPARWRLVVVNASTAEASYTADAYLMD